MRVPTGGDNWTVNVGQYWSNDPKAPFANRHAASMRAIYDLADLEKSQFIYQTGQSGLVFSPRYRDMSDAWAAVQYRPLRLQPRRLGARGEAGAVARELRRRAAPARFLTGTAARRSDFSSAA